MHVTLAFGNWELFGEVALLEAGYDCTVLIVVISEAIPASFSSTGISCGYCVEVGMVGCPFVPSSKNLRC
jgi:hypothetical protein